MFFPATEWMIVGFTPLDNSPLPTEIGQLTDLESFIVPDIALTGNIPSEIGLLTKLSKFSLACSACLSVPHCAN